MQRTLQKKLIGPQAQRELLAFLGNHLPHFNTPASTAAWLKKAKTLRGEMLALFFRGHPTGLLTEKTQVHWGDRIQTGQVISSANCATKAIPASGSPLYSTNPVT